MEHSFDIEIAQKYGIEEAILLKHIYFWVKRNEINGKNIINGKAWTYNSKRAFVELFPYLSERKVKYALDNLRNKKLIEVGNFNEDKFDKTLWYTLTEVGTALVEHREVKNEKSVYGLDNFVQHVGQNCPVYPYTDIKHTDITDVLDAEDGASGSSEKDNEKKAAKEDEPLKQFGEFVFMREKEYAKLVDEFGSHAAGEQIDILDNYIGSLPERKQNEYIKRNHYRCIRSWVVNRWRETHQREQARHGGYANYFYRNDTEAGIRGALEILNQEQQEQRE